MPQLVRRNEQTLHLNVNECGQTRRERELCEASLAPKSRIRTSAEKNVKKGVDVQLHESN
jgi:hypothetical protein